MVTLEQIYASKIFQSSKRKDRILSAFNTSGMNARLDIQSPDSVSPEFRKNTVRQVVKPETSEESEKGSIRPSESSGGGGGGSFSGGGDLPTFDDLVDVPDLEEGSDEGGDDTLDSEPSENVSIDSQEPVQESTDVQVELDLDALKTDLNANDATAGVNRIKKRDNELWIYYSDEVNLNNTMVDTIEAVQAFDRDAEFNRLARSENAMVFQIPGGDSNEGKEA